MESRLWLSEPMLGLCWANVGPMLGHLEVLAGLCWARCSHICGARMWGFWCPTNLVSDNAHVGHNGVTFVIARVYVRLGVCWAYVGAMLGYSDGWVGLCWARYSHICGAQMSRFWCPTNSVSDSALYELPPAKPIKMFCAPAIHVSKISMKSIIQEAHICHLEEALYITYITIKNIWSLWNDPWFSWKAHFIEVKTWGTS